MRMVDGEEMYGIEDVKYEEDTFCEHCGKLEPFESVLDDNYTRWCMNCAAMRAEFVLSEDERRQIRINEATMKLDYHQKQADSLRRYIIRLKNESEA